MIVKMLASAILGSACLICMGSTNAIAQVTTLSVGSWAGPNHAISAVGLKQWGELLEKKSNGTLKIEVTFPPVNPRVMYDRAREGINDITWGFNGYTPGRFVTYQLVELPGLGAGSEAASIAYWRTHTKHLAAANEYRGVRLLSLFAQPPSVIHSRKRIESLTDLRGFKVRAGGGVQADVATHLSMVPVQAPVPEAYAMVKDGVVDGTFFPTETAVSFKLHEVAPYQLGFPEGLFGAAYFVVMNPDRYQQLSPEHQKILDETTGEVLAKLIGRAWDDAEKKAIDSLRNSPDGGFRMADANFSKEVMARLKPIERAAVEAVKKKGVDAEAALAYLRTEAKSLAATR